MIIYKVTNKLNQKVYIGQTNNRLNVRKGQHLQAAKEKDFKFCRALKKYGFENFTWEVMFECSSQEELNEKEILYIEFYNSVKNGYNCRSGGKSGGKHSDETRKKQSLIKRGDKHPRYNKVQTSHEKQARLKTRKNNGNV